MPNKEAVGHIPHLCPVEWGAEVSLDETLAAGESILDAVMALSVGHDFLAGVREIAARTGSADQWISLVTREKAIIHPLKLMTS